MHKAKTLRIGNQEGLRSVNTRFQRHEAAAFYADNRCDEGE